MSVKKRYYGFLIAVLAVFFLAAPAMAADISADTGNSAVSADAAEDADQFDADELEETDEELFTGVCADLTGETADYYYYEFGERVSYTGFAQDADGIWYYVADGIVDFAKNSVIRDESGALGSAGTYWYVLGGIVQTDFTGLADYANANGWWYITDGKVDFSYTGFASNKNGWFYVEKSKVTLQKNSVIYGEVNETSAWWYVVGSKVQTSFTGLADYANENGWFYIRNGKVDFSVNTVAKNKNGWYYVTEGKVK